jgi:rSAM/selenodomain-associated transferase 2
VRVDREVAPAGAPGVGIAVVIPVLDEAARIAARLVEVGAVAGVEEVVVVDGGSADRTCEIVRGVPGVRLLAAPRGRGRQMNAGARGTTAPVLLFLHADVSLPADAGRWVAAALTDRGVVGGAFRTWTVPDAPAAGRAGPVRRLAAAFLHLADVRSRCARLPYGDQALFVRRTAFERAGGFPDQALMEDVELARRLRRLGRLVTVPASVRVSGRRLLARPLRSALLLRLVPLLYRLGVSPERLARLYGDPR